MHFWLSSPAAPAIVQWAHEEGGYGGRNGGYACTQRHGIPPTKADLVTTAAECPACEQQKPLTPQYGTIPMFLK